VFGKEPLALALTGMTNDDSDISLDNLRAVTLPLLAQFGVEGAALKVWPVHVQRLYAAPSHECPAGYLYMQSFCMQHPVVSAMLI
jgi:hypothetical protein